MRNSKSLRLEHSHRAEIWFINYTCGFHIITIQDVRCKRLMIIFQSVCGKVPHLACIQFTLLTFHQYPCDEHTHVYNSPFLWQTWKVTGLEVGSLRVQKFERRECLFFLAWFRGIWATIKEAGCVLGFYSALFAAWAAQLNKCEREESSTNWERYFCIERIKCGGSQRSKTHFLHSMLTWNLNKWVWNVFLVRLKKIAIRQKYPLNSI